MNIATVKEAQKKAQEFSSTCADVLKWAGADDPMAGGFGSPDSARCRRVSMELTKALAKMRKPR